VVSASGQGEPGIAAISSYLPERVIDNDEVAARFGFERAFLDDKIGIRQRHIARADESVADMAVAAAERLLESEHVKRTELGLLVLCTQNPDYRLPATADIVQDRLKLPTSVAAFDINQGCSGYVYGLSIAKAMMSANGIGVGLLITSEAYSKVMDWADRNTVPVFGDGASATLLRADAPGRLGRFTFGSDGSGANELIVRAGGSRHPDIACAGANALHMNGRSIFNFMMRRVPADVEACLAANQMTKSDIDLFVFHQASRYMVESLAREMRLEKARVPVMMADFANTVSSTIPMTLEALGGLGALAGKKLLLSGFGVGLSWASTVLQVQA
jgi:3-oxoacyl-[acyl-carrier-protein] synthase-3